MTSVPLLCLHGWGMNGGAFAPLRSALHEYASDALDLPGHGKRPWRAEHAGLAAHAALLASELPQRCVLVGWSMGGQLALELARQHPERVQALVLLATTPKFPQTQDWPHGLDSRTRTVFRMMLERDWRQTLDDFIALQLRGSRDAANVQQALQQSLLEHGLPVAAAMQAGLAWLDDVDLRAAIREVQQPALVIAGQHDRVTPPAAGRWLAEQLPQAQYVEVARAGHAPHLSHTEEVCAAMRPFLQQLCQ
jgi:pimeloyl-[acyl-carrier protein] methyl ester esterase